MNSHDPVYPDVAVPYMLSGTILTLLVCTHTHARANPFLVADPASVFHFRLVHYHQT